jgi:RimJ/RimL family protein N-acetyltransferase
MIHFRTHTKEDIPLRVRWLNNPAANQYAVDDPTHVTTEEEQSQWFAEYDKKRELGEKKFFTILEDDRPIGFMGLSNIDGVKRTAEAFILIGEDDRRGHGIGKEAMRYLISYAFSELKLGSVYLTGVKKSNAPAINLYRGLGFQETSKNDEEVDMSLRSMSGLWNGEIFMFPKNL